MFLIHVLKRGMADGYNRTKPSWFDTIYAVEIYIYQDKI